MRPGQCSRAAGANLVIDEAAAMRSAVKYGRAIAHTCKLVSAVRAGSGSTGWELEFAVDETEQVTTHLEHIYIVLELRRLGVELISFAPRYLGEFEKALTTSATWMPSNAIWPCTPRSRDSLDLTSSASTPAQTNSASSTAWLSTLEDWST